MKKRFVYELKKYIPFCLAGIIYYIWVITTKLYIPCVFKLLTGFKCPGCGITHMLVALFHCDFSAAFYSNEMLFVALPFAAAFYIADEICYIKNGKRIKRTGLTDVLQYIFLALLIIFGIVRNIR